MFGTLDCNLGVDQRDYELGADSATAWLKHENCSKSVMNRKRRILNSTNQHCCDYDDVGTDDPDNLCLGDNENIKSWDRSRTEHSKSLSEMIS